MILKHLPESERPRERLFLRGVQALSLTELLALLLGAGTAKLSAIDLAQQLLAQFGSLQKIAAASLTDLEKIPGIGRAKAATLLAALELSSRMNEEGSSFKKQITSPEDIYKLTREIKCSKREKLMLVLRDVHGSLLKTLLLGEGTLDQILVHPSEVFHEALLHRSKRMILVHNHPSGMTSPSNADLQITYRLAECGKLLDIALDDHLIVGESGYFSLWKEGLLLNSRIYY